MTSWRSLYAFINFGSIPSPIFSHILKCSILTKWHQLESMSGHANEHDESETAKRWLFTISLCFYQFLVNFTHFQSNFKMLNIDKVASAGIYVRTCQIWVRKSKKVWLFMISLCFYQFWVSFTHFQSNFETLNVNPRLVVVVLWVMSDSLWPFWWCHSNYADLVQYGTLQWQTNLYRFLDTIRPAGFLPASSALSLHHSLNNYLL